MSVQIPNHTARMLLEILQAVKKRDPNFQYPKIDGCIGVLKEQLLPIQPIDVPDVFADTLPEIEP